MLAPSAIADRNPPPRYIHETGRAPDGSWGEAWFSHDRAYRWKLTRAWNDLAGDSVHPMIFTMLNPSKAGAVRNDQTVTACCGFARRAGASGIVVVNAFAYIATNPAELAQVPDPVGQWNDEYLREAVTAPGPVVVAWGAVGKPQRDRIAAVEQIIRESGKAPWCLGLTGAGCPRHPCRLASATPLERYPHIGLTP
jgi:hypothetical protein